MSESIKLNFINKSSDTNNSNVVIFQQNVAEDFNEIAVAWKVIKNCGQYDNHPFVFPMGYTANVTDSYDNMTPYVDIYNGQAYHAKEHPTGITLAYASPTANVNQIQVSNQLPAGSIDANIYKNGALLAAKAAVLPQQHAIFEFKPTIWIGVVQDVNEGDVLNSAILSQINTELSLFGVSSADIVMTGGGPGPNSTPYTFTLENIAKA
jgi:hypothetical protein